MYRLVRGRNMNKNILSFLPAMKQKSPREWCGACLLCGQAKEDGFIVILSAEGRARYFCRKCGASGDDIDFLVQRYGMSYREACEALGIEPKCTATSSFPARHTHASHRPVRPAQVTHVPPVPPKPAVLPCEKWTNSAARLVGECQGNLITPSGYEFLGQRFLTEDTARRFLFGWNPADRYEQRQDWGLEPYSDPNGKLHDKMIVPRGAILPIQREGRVVALLVRCADDRPAKRPRYWEVVGGARGLPFFAGGHSKPTVLVESLLDAALLWQESQGLVAVVATCGGSKPLDADTHAFIQAAPLLLATPDNDEGGQSAWQRWSAAYPQAILTPAVGAKDLGDMHAAALSWPINEGIPTTGEWLTAALSIARETARTSTVRDDNAEDTPNYGAEMKAAAKAA